MMNNKNLILVLALFLACSLDAVASDIYKRVNPDGTIEYSDRPSSDAAKVEVKPNVVQTNPVKPRASSQSSSSQSKTTEPSERRSKASEADETEYVRASTRRERSERARKNNPNFVEEPNNREAVVDPDPNPGRATRNAARNATSPR